MKLAELPYYRNSANLFGLIAAEPWSIFLDSGFPGTASGRYDVLSADPYLTFTTFGKETHVNDGEHTDISQDDPFVLIRRALGNTANNPTDLPFCGGAMGCFAYDLGRRIECLPDRSVRDIDVPDMAIGLYDWAVIIDHQQRRSWLAGQGRDHRTAIQWQALLDLFQTTGPDRLPEFTVNSALSTNMNKQDYARAFEKIKNYIRAGDCYQVNLAQRFAADVSGASWDIYLALRRHNPAPFSGYFNLPGMSVLSTSPERFLRVNDELVETKPIKGTMRRSKIACEDRKLARQLIESTKDRAENLMIVDLLRNDIGKNCLTGSIAVPELFALESFASVHHLVSTITGRLGADRHALDLLRGCFPGGSITGAPKLRAMQIIEELEPVRRNVYCGALGYIGFDGNMDTNIAIRTLIKYQDRVYCWAGGGIVADSDVEAEYQECFDKAASILELFDNGIVSKVKS